MVVEMRKYTFLIYHKEYEAFLQAIRELGAVHVIEKYSGVPDEASDLHRMLAEENYLKKITQALEVRLGKEKADKPDPKADAEKLISEYEALTEQKTKEQHRQGSLQKEISRLMPWGHFDVKNLERLRDAGYIVRFYTCAQRNFQPEWTELYHATVIRQEGSQLYFITITPSGEVVEIDTADRVKLPDMSLGELQEQLRESKVKSENLDKELDRFAKKNLNTLKTAAVRLRENFEYANVKLNTETQADDKLMLLEGWVPVTKVAQVDEYLKKEGIYYQQQKPSKTDNVPVLLKNNAFTRLFEAIGELYDLPNYHELDLTPFFAPFFVMFFGLCLGDAGYGLIITIVALIAWFKVKPKLKPFMMLAFVLGLGTVIFGILSGTLFGISLLDVQWPWIQGLKSFMMNTDQLFKFALIVGIFQIVFGMIIRAVSVTRRFGFRNSLANWGWLILIIGGGATYILKMLGSLSTETSKIVFYIVLGIAALGIFLFNDMDRVWRKPWVNIGAGLWDSYNMATGLLGDVLSYIRLFALGISGAVMGLVFNRLAIDLSGTTPVVSQLLFVIILLFGHGMNIFMNGLGAFVHPMRLTFVEFYKNAGFEGGGKKYRPFARKEQESEE